MNKFYFNMDAFKHTIFDRLKITEPGPRMIHIPKETVTYTDRGGVKRSYSTTFNTSFYMELCSERFMMVRQKDGTQRGKWVKISQSARNEPLDLMDNVYGLYETQKVGGYIGQLYGRVQRMMMEKENAVTPKPEAPKGRNHGLCICRHLPQAISINDLDIREVAEDLEHAPLFWGRFVAQYFFRETRNRGRNFFRALFRRIEMFLKLRFRHRGLACIVK